MKIFMCYVRRQEKGDSLISLSPAEIYPSLCTPRKLQRNVLFYSWEVKKKKGVKKMNKEIKRRDLRSCFFLSKKKRKNFCVL